MNTAVKLSFELQTVTLELGKILPTKALSTVAKESSTYKTIEASLGVVGLVEPLVVFRQKDGTYLLLEGHGRLSALLAAGEGTAECLVSTTETGLVYKRFVNHLSPIQANRMIVKVLDAGVPEERLATALNRPVSTIRMSRTMLKDICDDALEILKDKPIADGALRLFKHVKAPRQIEMADLMSKMGNYTKSYAAAIVSRTKPDLMVDHVGEKPPARPKQEDLARMAIEMEALERDILLIDESYGRNVVNLTIARGYVKKLLENARVRKYLAAKHGDVFAEFQRIQEAASLEA